jgi:hypothetical protein
MARLQQGFEKNDDGLLQCCRKRLTSERSTLPLNWLPWRARKRAISRSAFRRLASPIASTIRIKCFVCSAWKVQKTHSKA